MATLRNFSIRNKLANHVQIILYNSITSVKIKFTLHYLIKKTLQYYLITYNENCISIHYFLT